MENQSDNGEGQQERDPTEVDQETTHNLKILGPYESLATRIFDEALKTLVIPARGLINLSIWIAPATEKDMLKGLRGEMDGIDGYVAKLLWSFGAPLTAIRCYFIKTLIKKKNKNKNHNKNGAPANTGALSDMPSRE